VESRHLNTCTLSTLLESTNKLFKTFVISLSDRIRRCFQFILFKRVETTFECTKKSCNVKENNKRENNECHCKNENVSRNPYFWHCFFLLKSFWKDNQNPAPGEANIPLKGQKATGFAIFVDFHSNLRLALRTWYRNLPSRKHSLPERQNRTSPGKTFAERDIMKGDVFYKEMFFFYSDELYIKNTWKTYWFQMTQNSYHSSERKTSKYSLNISYIVLKIRKFILKTMPQIQ